MRPTYASSAAHFFFPVRGKHIQFRVWIKRMSSRDFLVYSDTPTWRCRNLIVAVFYRWNRGRQFCTPWHVVVLKCFEDHEVGDVRGQVHSSNALQRPIAAVRRDTHFI